MRIVRFLPLCLLPLLAACVNDRVAYEVPDSTEIITLIREQQWFWDPKVELSLVVARMPNCMRRHPPVPGTAATVVELYQYEPTTFIVKIGDKLWATETRTCEGFAPMDKAPEQGLGSKLGTWKPNGEAITFVAEKAAG
ncbi:MAG TPA: hypothetical protein PLW86_09365 [Rhodocyclaceae bacterium]|nr:hypothetical protein [Rhodocyclaceae bacterium]